MLPRWQRDFAARTKIRIEVSIKLYRGFKVDIGKIVKLVAVIVALIAGLMGGLPQSALVIAVLGAVAGYFVAEEDRQRFLIAIIALAAAGVAGGLNGIPVLGEHVANALGGLTGLLQAGAVTVILIGTYEKVKP